MIKNITCVANVPTDHKGLLIEMKKTKDGEKFSWISFKKDTGSVIPNSYVVKTKSTGKRNVLLLQTLLFTILVAPTKKVFNAKLLKGFLGQVSKSLTVYVTVCVKSKIPG